jgi:hypothetical protein
LAISNNNTGLTNGTNPNRVSVNLNASNSTIPQYGINNNNSNSLNKNMISSPINTSRLFILFFFYSLPRTLYKIRYLKILIYKRKKKKFHKS